MKSTEKRILTINGGSSSIKFAIYQVEVSLTLILSGEIENIGTKYAKLTFNDCNAHKKDSIGIAAATYEAASNCLVDWMDQQRMDQVIAIGHRIVHGMQHTEPELINPELIQELKEISAFDPEHLPEEIKLIELFNKRYPAIPQIACFDTSFHTSMPAIAKMLSIPRRYYDKGIQRYGFHGLSYSYLMEELKSVAGEKAAQGKVILAHLGSGASLAAVKDGVSMDTSMGFTPTSGLMMGTRTGDLDPGVAWYLMKSEKLSPMQFNNLINSQSGMLGVSETSADMRELIRGQDMDSCAADAIALFCYQVKKWIGSFTTVLGGLDTLIFSGGIGENIPEVRARVCHGMNFIGIDLDNTKNLRNEPIISNDVGNVCIRVIKTNEELMIARLVCGVLNYT
jgi:acetate kinase